MLDTTLDDSSPLLSNDATQRALVEGEGNTEAGVEPAWACPGAKSSDSTSDGDSSLATAAEIEKIVAQFGVYNSSILG